MLNRAHRQSVPRLEADYVATPKNGIVAGLRDRPDLQRIHHGSARHAIEPVELWGDASWIHLRKGR
jgi:hypothetical protein